LTEWHRRKQHEALVDYHRSMANWLVPLITGVLGAAAVVTGVLVTQRSERRQAHEDRLWTERASLYVEILAWANDVNAWALRRTPGPGAPLQPKPGSLPRLLHARVIAFAGPSVRRWAEAVDYELLDPDEPPMPACQLHVLADALQDAVQLEIQQLRSRSEREHVQMGIGQGSLQNLFRGQGPRPRPPDTPAIS
jgi:hypothetical protein